MGKRGKMNFVQNTSEGAESMAIRSTAKAMILREGRILLNECKDGDGLTYYDLPGGGQNQYESIEEAVVRECREETGYRIRPIRFAALAEEINDHADCRREHPEYTHRIFHIFLCELDDKQREEPTEADLGQLRSVWVPVGEADVLPVLPRALRGRIAEVLADSAPAYFGVSHICIR